MDTTRRALLQGLGVISLLSAGHGMALAAEPAGAVLPAPPPPRPDLVTPFSYDHLIDMAKTMSGQGYQPLKPTASKWLDSLSYDDHQRIHHSDDRAYWKDDNYPFRLEFFHLGAIFLVPVEISEVVNGQALPLAYDPSLFSFGTLKVPEDFNPTEVGYAGFRVHSPINRPDKFDEFLVFLGASYFRAVGRHQSYGLSARGLAIDTGSARGEEFPVFRNFWIERPSGRDRSITIYALLDSPSATGAYCFKVTPGEESKMDVSARLFLRRDVERLGIAPLTSMFAFGENDRRITRDFRPEVHDSDGLMIETDSGEWLWRPLINPDRLGISSFSVTDPHGFGLIQRDRRFTSYEDMQAHYETRPSLWVEPKGQWGEGAVQLVEIPTDSEIHDNIVAYWVPKAPVVAGQALSFDYALSWGRGPRPPLAHVVSTRIGRQFDHGATKFIIDFQSLTEVQQSADAMPQVELQTNTGEIAHQVIMPNPHTGGWRVAFDLKPVPDTVHELRCILKKDGTTVSETWSYQYHS